MLPCFMCCSPNEQSCMKNRCFLRYWLMMMLLSTICLSICSSFCKKCFSRVGNMFFRRLIHLYRSFSNCHSKSVRTFLTNDCFFEDKQLFSWSFLNWLNFPDTTLVRAKLSVTCVFNSWQWSKFNFMSIILSQASAIAQPTLTFGWQLWDHSFKSHHCVLE